MSTIENGKYKGIDSSKREEIINQGGTILGAPILIKDDNTFAVNATEINWKGYNLDDNFTYTGDLISYITSSYSYILDTLSNFSPSVDYDKPWEDIETKTQFALYKRSISKTSVDYPFVDEDNADEITYFDSGSSDNNYWALSLDNSNTLGDYIWMSSYYAVFGLKDNDYNSFLRWEGPSIAPVLLNGTKGDTGAQGKPADYYEQRWGLFGENDIISVPGNEYSPDLDTEQMVWHLTPGVNTNNKALYLTTRKVTYEGKNNTKIYDPNSSWSTPIRISGRNGVDGTSNPIQPVLKYTWFDYYDDGIHYPAYIANEQNPDSKGSRWFESPGNPSGSNIYLWMIQGQRFNGEMLDLIDNDNSTTPNTYWHNAVCLSGKDGEPGADGDDIEFIYKRFEEPYQFNNNDNYNPSTWYTSSSVNKPTIEWTSENPNTAYSYMTDYVGPIIDGVTYSWSDHPEGVTSTYKYEYATYRKTHKVNGESYWEAFNTPFAWSIYGEDGIDGDGLEYIYWVGSSTNCPNPPAFNLDPSSFQKSEVYDGNIWYDDPRSLDSTINTYQFVSTRKYRKITDTNKSKISASFTGSSYEMGGITVNVGDKIWFPYSDPELWNWYVKDGTNAPQIVMVYQRTANGTSAPAVPAGKGAYVISTAENGSQGSWAESPGNSALNYTYLWMTSAHYTRRSAIFGQSSVDYTIEDTWQTPVCLTGEAGKDGQDGTDIEFIYLRTNQPEQYKPSVPQGTNGNNQVADWPFGEYTSENGILFVNGTYINNQSMSFENHTNDNLLYNVWTDNPLGVSTSYNFEYAAIRNKNNKTWGSFGNPFLWSKYGEDGIDGDGIEYIFYLSEGTNEPVWGSTVNSNNPSMWDAVQQDEWIEPHYKYIYTDPNTDPGWSDDPRGVSDVRKWEYVSVRHKRLNPNTGKKEWGQYSAPALWSKYASDAQATNLTLESDNDSMAVSINDEDVISVPVTSVAYFSMYHNTITVPTSYYNMSIIDTNLSNAKIGYDTNNSYSYLKYAVGNTEHILAKLSYYNNINNPSKSTYYLTTSLYEGFDMTNIDGELRIRSQANITDPSFDNSGILSQGDNRIFTNKVTGLHIQIDDIYQLQLDRNVVKRNPNDELDIVFIKLKSLTSNNVINTPAELANKNLHVYCNDTVIDDITLPVDLLEYGTISDDSFKFELKYNNNILMDTEYVSVISDGQQGNPGTDSKSQEFIYMLTNNIDFFNDSSLSNYYKPDIWKDNVTMSTEYNTDDYPFISINGLQNIEGISYISYIYNKQGHNKVWANKREYNSTINAYGGVWTDNPQGISEEFPYEWWATRSYDTTNKIWESFSKPVIRANWGHSGEDGDGVEYIYYRSNSSSLGLYPVQWTNDTNFQNAEYIKSGTSWSDNPKGVTSSNAYEYVSTRKYRNINQYYLYSTLIDPLLRDQIQYDYDTVTSEIYFEQGEEPSILEYLYSICENYLDGESEISSDIFIGDFRSDYYNEHEHGSDLYQYFYEVISKYFNPILYSGSTDQGNSTTDYFKLEQKTEKMWGPYSEPKLWAKYGQDGQDGQPGTSGLTLDWDNNNICLAVNGSGNIITVDSNSNTQSKTSQLHLYNTNSTIDSVQLNISDEDWSSHWLNNSSITYSFVKTTGRSISGESVEQTRGGNIGDLSPSGDIGGGFNEGGNEKPIDNLQLADIEISFTYTNSLVDCTITTNSNKILSGSTTATSSVTIPESGRSIPLVLSIGGNDYYTSLNILGQHNGENAVTFEIIPSANAVVYENNNYNPLAISYVVNKYEGSTITNINSSLNNYNLKIRASYDGLYSAGAPINGQYILNTFEPYTYLNIELVKEKTIGSTTIDSIIDSETIPIVKNGEQGEQGSQGFTGPIVRYRGEWKGYARYTSYTVGGINYEGKIVPDLTKSSSEWTAALAAAGITGGNTWVNKVTYVNGNYNNNTAFALSQKYCSGKTNTDTTNGYPIYSESNGPIYLDIVYDKDQSGKIIYYTPNPNVDLKWFNSSIIDTITTNGIGGTSGTSYLNGWAKPSSNLSNNGQLYWIEANQYDFIATKLLYADQALINQISTHDLIATDSDGNPVAGITSGKKMYDQNNNQIYSILDSQSMSGWDHQITNTNEDDPSNVRIFAGKIWNNNSYSLTYAPFNVRQDGTTYMTKAVIQGDITANSLSLGNGSFYNAQNESGSWWDNSNSMKRHDKNVNEIFTDTSKTKTFYILTSKLTVTVNGQAQIGSRVTLWSANNNLTFRLATDSMCHEWIYNGLNYITLPPNCLIQLIQIGSEINIIEIPLTASNTIINNPIYYDVTSDVDLILKCWDSDASHTACIGNWYNTKLANNNLGLAPALSYTSDGAVVIDFYTYLHQNPALLNYDYAYADFNRLFGWVIGTVQG